MRPLANQTRSPRTGSGTHANDGASREAGSSACRETAAPGPANALASGFGRRSSPSPATGREMPAPLQHAGVAA